MAASIGLRVMGWGSVMIATGALGVVSGGVSLGLVFTDGFEIGVGRPLPIKRHPLLSFVLIAIAVLGLALTSYSLISATCLIGKALYLQTSVPSLAAPLIDASIGSVSAFICLIITVWSGSPAPAANALGVQPFAGQAFQLRDNDPA